MKTMRSFLLLVMAFFFLCPAARAEDREITVDEGKGLMQALLEQGADSRLYTELRRISPDGEKLSCDDPAKFEIRRLQPGIYWLKDGATVDQKRLARCLEVENQLFGKGAVAQTAPLVSTNVTASKSDAVASSKTVTPSEPSSVAPATTASGALFVDSVTNRRPFVLIMAPEYAEPEQSIVVTWKAGDVESLTFNDGIQVISNLPLEGTAVRKVSESRNFVVEAKARNGEIIRAVHTVRIKPASSPPPKTTGLETGIVLALGVAIFGVLFMGIVAGYFLGSSLRASAPTRVDASSEPPPDPEKSWPHMPALSMVQGGRSVRRSATVQAVAKQPELDSVQTTIDPVAFVEMRQSQTGTFRSPTLEPFPEPFSAQAIKVMSTSPEQLFWETVVESGIGGVMGNQVYEDREGCKYVAFSHKVEDEELDALIQKLKTVGFSPHRETPQRDKSRVKYKLYLRPYSRH